MEIAAPGRMRLATKLRGKPQTGARPTINRRSGKPLKKRPKKPSTSPAVNQGKLASVAVAIRWFLRGSFYDVGLLLQGRGGSVCVRTGKETAGPSTPLRSGRDDKLVWVPA